MAPGVSLRTSESLGETKGCRGLSRRGDGPGRTGPVSGAGLGRHPQERNDTRTPPTLLSVLRAKRRSQVRLETFGPKIGAQTETQVWDLERKGVYGTNGGGDCKERCIPPGPPVMWRLYSPSLTVLGHNRSLRRKTRRSS